MLRRLVLVTVVLGCSGLGCGLRDQPLSWDGAVVTTGTGGSSNTGGRGGTGGKGGRGRGAGGDGRRRPGCAGLYPGSACPPANPCHVGQTACSGGVASCTDTQQPQANGTVCGTDKVCMSGSCATCSAGASARRRTRVERGRSRAQPAPPSARNPATSRTERCAAGDGLPRRTVWRLRGRRELRARESLPSRRAGLLDRDAGLQRQGDARSPPGPAAARTRSAAQRGAA